jgi:hypothetical protein
VHPILVAGTGSYNDDDRVDWYTPTSPFARFLASQSLAPAFEHWRDTSDLTRQAPFIWSTSLAGIPLISRKATWSAAGTALAYFIAVTADVRGAQTAVIAHSHGLQVVLYACAERGIKIAQLISVGSPVRKDMEPIAQRARPLIGHWLHIHSDRSDQWQWFGELFNGHFGIVRAHPLANRNDAVARVGHSQLLRDPACQSYWLDRGWLMPLRDWIPDGTLGTPLGTPPGPPDRP